MAQGFAPEVWTQQGFDFTAEVVDEYQSGGYGVPQEMVPAIASAVLDTLAELDINPHNVYLSGHDGLEADPDGAKLRAFEEAHQYDEYAFPDADYDEDTLDKVDYSEQADLEAQAGGAAREDAILEALDEPEKPVYAMSDVFALHHDADAHTNPIHYAGISPKSTIVVYDKTLMDRWDPDVPGEAFEHGLSIVATEAELAVATLARIRLRYRIEGEQDESPAPVPNN